MEGGGVYMKQEEIAGGNASQYLMNGSAFSEKPKLYANIANT